MGLKVGTVKIEAYNENWKLMFKEEKENLIKVFGDIALQIEHIGSTSIPGLSAVKPKAAFYIFPKIDVKKFNITDDEKFTLDLLREKKILVTCGTGFNWKSPDHFRIVFLPEIRTLRKATEKLADFMETYKQ